jgi:glyoxylase-like metal-dependent hydrolase (beta-lactamase superfamily II)
MEMSPVPYSRRRFLASAGVLSAGILAFPASLFAAESPVITIVNEARKSPLKLSKLRSSITVIEGSGGNICVLTGRQELLLVDAGIDVSKAKMQAALARLSDKPVKQLINTHWHFDHASGNEWLHQAGATITAHENTRKHLQKTVRVEDWSYTFPPAPADAIPSVVFARERTMHLGQETIQLRHYAPAHTDSDIAVYFEQADVLHVGDTWWNGYYPFLDYNTGGDVNGMMQAAEANIARTTAKTIIIPGHGPVGTRAQLVAYRDMLGEVMHRVRALKNQGHSLQQAVASRPTQPFDAQWGNFVISGALFTNLVYRSV